MSESLVPLEHLPELSSLDEKGQGQRQGDRPVGQHDADQTPQQEEAWREPARCRVQMNDEAREDEEKVHAQVAAGEGGPGPGRNRAAGPMKGEQRMKEGDGQCREKSSRLERADRLRLPW